MNFELKKLEIFCVKPNLCKQICVRLIYATIQIFCHSCLKIIKCNINPVKCAHCCSLFHKKCAKLIDKNFLPFFNCKSCQDWSFPFSSLTYKDFCKEVLVSLFEDNVDLNADHLNLLFSNNATNCKNGSDNYDSSYLDNVTKQQWWASYFLKVTSYKLQLLGKKSN